MPSTSTRTLSGRAPPPIRLSFVRWTAASAAVVALLAVAVYAGAIRLGETLRLAGASADPAPMVLVVGETGFRFPANTIRFPEHRTSRPQAELDLYLAWPDLTGFTLATADIFQDPEAKSLLFLRLSAMGTKELDGDSEAAAAPERPGPSRLTQTRRPGLPGVASEEIVYRAEPGRTPRYQASCLDGPDPIMAADCIREIGIEGGLRLRYRFSHRLLADWDAMDRAVLRYVFEHRRS